MIDFVLFSATLAAVFGLAYSLGYQAGRLQGKREGFESALLRAIETQRPLEALRRVLVPRKAA